MDSVLGLAGKCESEGVRDPLRRRGQGVRVRRRRVGRSGRHEPGPDRGRRAGRASRRARGRSSFWAMLGLPPTIDVRTPSGDVVQGPPDVDLLEPAGGRDHGRPADVRHRRRRRSAGHPPRHRRAALHGRGQARHRRALGDLLQARPPRRAGRCLAARRRGRARARPLPVRRPTSTRLPGHVVRGALTLDEPLRGQAARSTRRRARAASARSPPTTSRSSTT